MAKTISIVLKSSYIMVEIFSYYFVIYRSCILWYNLHMNERKTEILVRDHFSQFQDILLVEEQRSDNPQIDKLLKNASKKGGGRGYPEFIISYRTNNDFIIVVECKADIAKHESNEHNKYAEFAVDGVLLYASFLSKAFDVLAIAASGQSKRELKISHFLLLKNEKKPINIFGDKLLTAEEYLNGYLKSEEKYRQDYNSLLDFSKQLNEVLHKNKIRENDRALLISAILIALENKAFYKSYSSHKKPENLAVSLVQTVSDELENANITGNKLQNLNVQFSFIKTDTSLSKKENILKNIIDSIDTNINVFIKTYKYFDVLGQLYIEFLRYANGDKGLGVVLTPPHVTELFSELAQVNKNSVIYDNCVGTGGFLISAMHQMIIDAKGDERKIKEIKSRQLIGTEYQAHIYALAVSNMYIHQDGKTNIINGNCFDYEVISKVKKQNPTIGFLNPPYKSDKKNDTEELEFVLNNLECLVDGAVCIAIIPMQSVLAQSGAAFELKRKLLSKHTLEAVLSMPEELFHNSKVAPVSVVVIITAHKPHPKAKKTFLADFRDDKFVITKDRGRIDINGTWSKIKNEWKNLYLNREEKKSICLLKVLTPDAEWCIEAFRIIEYSIITENTYRNYIQKYLAFRLLYNLFDLKIEKQDIIEYEDILVSLDYLFNVYNGLSSSEVEVLESWCDNNTIRYIRPSQTYEGTIAGYVNKLYIDDKYIYPNNTLYVSTDGQGSHTYSYVSSFEFVPNSNVSVLIPKQKMSLSEKLYYAMCISANRCNFSYGRKPKGDRLKSILIPKTPPAFVYKNIFGDVFLEWKKIIN